jgi:hypothetical protein
MLAIGSAVALMGWFLRYMIGGMRADTEANTEAINLLTRELGQLRVEMAERGAADARAEAAELRRQRHRRDR